MLACVCVNCLADLLFDGVCVCLCLLRSCVCAFVDVSELDFVFVEPSYFSDVSLPHD